MNEENRSMCWSCKRLEAAQTIIENMDNRIRRLKFDVWVWQAVAGLSLFINVVLLVKIKH